MHRTPCMSLYSAVTQSLSGMLTRILPALAEGSPGSTRLIQAFLLSFIHHLLSGPYKSFLTILPPIPAPSNPLLHHKSTDSSGFSFPWASQSPACNPQQLVTAWLITLPLRIQLILMVIHFFEFLLCARHWAEHCCMHSCIFQNVLLWKIF